MRRGPSSPSGPRPSAPCARSAPGSAPPRTCPAVLQRAVDEAARLLAAEGARIDLSTRPWTCSARRTPRARSARRRRTGPTTRTRRLDEGISGKSVVDRPGRVWTGDYIEGPTRSTHGRPGDAFVRRVGIRSVMAAPLIGEAGPFGALTVFAGRTDAWGESDAALLVAIADQASITITHDPPDRGARPFA